MLLEEAYEAFFENDEKDERSNNFACEGHGKILGDISTE